MFGFHDQPQGARAWDVNCGIYSVLPYRTQHQYARNTTNEESKKAPTRELGEQQQALKNTSDSLHGACSPSPPKSRTALEITLSWEQKWECRPILQLITRVPIILLRTHNSTHAALAGSLFHVQPHPYSGLWQSEHESFAIQTDTSGDRDISNELKKGLSQSYQSKFNQCGMEFRPYLKTLHNFTPIGMFMMQNK
ncbi:uncharacterized protein PADG_12428 [Paracoccidioides brasiliensis Pb18]|uniref:Uncharacterized protein n=1 Tax=Paracoccidioides brasiliensis (strain Pb18) TaxID=502780 RepID=A0A0A0HT35_PARBD|nr:uncharacterized protein PADG_12428 [Paracoccidioides brasiliensis Pb18]KGM91473.1 hypothetical protein PADG_12428 [Paracoccidioides brasiliensis Pb18]